MRRREGGTGPAVSRVTYEKGRLARVCVDGQLDVEAAETLAEILTQVLQDSPRRLELDLTGVTAYTRAGAGAVSQCLMMRRSLEDGVGIVVATEAGRRILLDSMRLV